MKIRADIAPEALPPALQRILNERRSARAFDPAAYLEQKTALLDRYFTAYNLDTAVVGISGGIDSAVVLGILKAAESVRTVVPVMLPAHDHSGVTGQDEAISRGHEVCHTFEVAPVILEVAPAAQVIADTVASGLNEVLPVSGSEWGTGQLVSYTRTPFLYYVATMLHDNGHRAVIAGTTNYSEGSYLGYVGKASDAMVDIQLISDLYKSEVYALAEHLGVPQSIRTATPTGDMFDACSDEEVFGATYDFVELFLEYLNDRAVPTFDPVAWTEGVEQSEEEYFTRHAESLKALHDINKHKYLAGSPAVHLDVRDFPLDIWKIQTWKREI